MSDAAFPPPSTEQLNVVAHLQSPECKSLLVTAVAGAGKTTTISYIIDQIRVPTLIITYSKHLKNETRHKLQRLNQQKPEVKYEFEVHSFHSFSATYFSHAPKASFSDLINLPPAKRSLPKRPLTHQIVIIDEVQDMTTELYQLIAYALENYAFPPKLVLIGDPRQCIFQFQGSDARFLTLADYLYPKWAPFHHVTLSESYRITPAMANLVNHLAKQTIITSYKKHDKLPVDYYNCIQTGPIPNVAGKNRWPPLRGMKKAFDHILHLITSQRYQPQQIFVLAYSLRVKMNEKGTPSQKCVHLLENFLVQHKIPCYVPISDESELDDKLIEGKVVFSTFHQAKGRERDLVILFDFSNFYYTMKKVTPPHKSFDQLNEEWYVALTRAKQQLIILGEIKSTISFFKLPAPDESTLNVIGPRLKNEFSSSSSPPRAYSATDLTNYMPDHLMRKLAPKVYELFIQQDTQPAVAKYSIQTIPATLPITFTQPTKEDVSDVTAVAFVGWYVDEIIRQTPKVAQDSSEASLTKLFDKIQNLGPKKIALRQEIAYRIPDIMSRPPPAYLTPSKIIEFYLKIANFTHNTMSGYHHRIIQINDYDWIDLDSWNQMIHNIYYTRYPDTQVESFEHSLPPKLHLETEVMLVGRVDMIEYDSNKHKRHLVEYKTVKEVKMEHFMQLLVYVWLIKSSKSYAMSFGDPTPDHHIQNIETFRLINLLTGETYWLHNPDNPEVFSRINYIITELIKQKIVGESNLTDEQFLTKVTTLPPAIPLVAETAFKIPLVEDETMDEEEISDGPQDCLF